MSLSIVQAKFQPASLPIENPSDCRVGFKLGNKMVIRLVVYLFALSVS
jgi:hypothetical protein